MSGPTAAASAEQTLCIDHSVVAWEPSWPVIDEILATRKARLALSLWNLVEIGAATDKSQRERRLAFLEKFNPLWTVERVDVLRQEVEGFLWKDVYGIEPREPLVFTPHLSVVDSYHAGADTRLGLTRGNGSLGLISTGWSS